MADLLEVEEVGNPIRVLHDCLRALVHGAALVAHSHIAVLHRSPRCLFRVGQALKQ
jgi:hypothetical protein